MVVLKQISFQSNGKCLFHSGKLFPSYVVLKNKEGKANVIRVGIPLVRFTNSLFCACILTPAIVYSKLAIEALEPAVEYVHS